MLPKESAEFPSWYTKVAGVDVTVYQDGDIDFDTEDFWAMETSLSELQKFLSDAQKYLHVRKIWREEN